MLGKPDGQDRFRIPSCVKNSQPADDTQESAESQYSHLQFSSRVFAAGLDRRFTAEAANRRETGQSDLFTARLDRIIDMGHPRVRLSHRIDWAYLEQEFGAVYSDGPGSPPWPTRPMAGLHILKYSENLSDERLCEAWAENPHYQYFCGEEFFQHPLPFDRSSLT